MSYNKATWTNNVTSLNKTNMDNIEKGIEAAHKGTHIYATSATGNDTYVVSFATPYTAYSAGMIINIKPDVGNTGAATVNVDTLGAKNIKKFSAGGKVALVTGNMIAGGIYTLIDDGTDFILCNPNCINTSIITASGDLVIGTAPNTPDILHKDTDGQLLSLVNGLPAWADNGISGTFSNTSTTVLANDYYIKTIALGGTYTKGTIMLQGYNSSGTYVMFDNTNTNAMAMCLGATNHVTIYSVAVNSMVSEGGAFGNNLTSSIFLDNVYISGTNLVLIFANGTAGNLTLQVPFAHYQVF